MSVNYSPLLLSMRNIHISYGEIKALQGVDFDLAYGEIHAIAGEHRAGKSSLVKILSGAERRKEGTILFEGSSIGHITPKLANALGIGIVYQNLTIIPDLNAVENIFIGFSKRKPIFFMNRKAMLTKAEEIFERIGFSVNLHTPVYRLSAVEQHMVEFARALLIDPKILILDELSNKFTPVEMKKIYKIIFELKSQGKSVIYISHDMDEILKLADRVTILKNGYRRETALVKNLDQFRLFQLTYSFSLNQQKHEYLDPRFSLLKRYLDNMIQDLPIGVIILDTENRVQLVNYLALELLDSDKISFVGRPIEELIKNLSSNIKTKINESVQNKLKCSFEDIIGKGKKEMKIEVIPLIDNEDNNIGTTVIIQDVSMDKYINEYLLQSTKMASVAEVAVGVAHEINNPLFVIQNYIELIKNKETDVLIIEKINKIEAELERIVSIVTNLLSFSKIKTIPGSVVNIKTIIEDTVLLLQHALNEKRIHLKKEFPSKEIFLQGDENKLKQLFMNLIMNSIDAVLDNGLIEIKVKEQPEDRFVEIVIEDNGSGIPEDVADKIFLPFYSTKISKKNTGLGLSISRHIVEAHKGTIVFTSIPGQLTRFIVRLPV